MCVTRRLSGWLQLGLLKSIALRENSAGLGHPELGADQRAVALQDLATLPVDVVGGQLRTHRHLFKLLMGSQVYRGLHPRVYDLISLYNGSSPLRACTPVDDSKVSCL